MRSPFCLICSLIVLLMVTACGPKTAADSTETQNPTTSSPSATDQTAPASDSMVADDDELMARGAPTDRSMSRMAFSFEQQFPHLHQLLQSTPTLYDQFSTYAQQVVTGDRIASEGDILQVIGQRDQTIIPKLNPIFEELDEDVFYEGIEGYVEELQQLGLSIATAEGMFVTLKGHKMLASQIETIGSEPLKLFLEFQQADANSMGGEYPYNNLAPYRDMILIGEELYANHPKSEYYTKIAPRFQEALSIFVGVFQVTEQDYQSYRVGDPMNQEYYLMSEGETLEAFVKENTQSRYHALISEKMKSISAISGKPENLYLVHFGTESTEEAAKARQFELLNAGVAASHLVRVKLGNGKSNYILTHSFFEDSEKASDVFDQLEPRHKDVKLMMCSIYKGELNQLGI